MLGGMPDVAELVVIKTQLSVGLLERGRWIRWRAQFRDPAQDVSKRIFGDG